LREKLFCRNHYKFVGEFTFVKGDVMSENLESFIDYIKENNIFYQQLKIGFGGSGNPIKRITYFKNDEIVVSNPNTYSFMIPQHSDEIMIRLYSRNQEELENVKSHYNYMLNIYNGNDTF
jgi:hypothetical protein